MTTLRVALRKYIDFENAMTVLVDRFHQERPEISVEVIPLDLEALSEELFTRNGLRNGMWDLALVVTDWLADAVSEGILEELTPYMNAAPIADWPVGWAHSLIEPIDFDGRFYCIPWHDGPECLIYRRDLFEAPDEQQAFEKRYGYPLAPPKTWRQFEDVTRFFTRPQEGLYGTVFACYPDGHNTLYDFALQLWSRGGELHDTRGIPTLATGQAKASLDFYRRLVLDASLCHPASIEFDSVSAGQAFLSGSIAMMVNWFGFASRVGCVGGALEEKVALAPIPSEEGIASASLSVFWNMAVASGSRYKQEAYEFLRFLARPESDREVVRHGVVGVRLSTWHDAEVQRDIPAFQEIEAISAGARLLPRTTSLPEFAEIVNRIVIAALNKNEPSDAILQRAQQEAMEKHLRFH